MRTFRLLTIATVLMGALAVPAWGAEQTVIPVGPFRSVELRNGGQLTVRHGSVRRVTILAGDPRCTQVEMEDRQHLVIDNHGANCRRDHRQQVEVVTPELGAVAVSNGGTLQTVGAFPAQAAITADVEQGGRLDIRSMAVDAVDASVYSGGGIFTTPRKTLAASVRSGGAITYWGDPRVTKSIRGGGVVTRGAQGEAGKPLSELSPRLVAPIPPLPPVPPVPPR